MRNAVLAQIILVVSAGVALLAAFGIDVTRDQLAALVGFVDAIGVLVIMANDRLVKPWRARRLTRG